MDGTSEGMPEGMEDGFSEGMLEADGAMDGCTFITGAAVMGAVGALVGSDVALGAVGLPVVPAGT
jgi:hypothetical protein